MQSANLVRVEGIVKATESDLKEYTGPDLAKPLLAESERIYRNFVFEDTGPRYSVPRRDRALFYGNPGLCDTMVVVLRKLLPKTVIVHSLNMVAPFDAPNSGLEYGRNFINRGHTISVVITPHGQVAIDPTYGFILVTKGDFFRKETFEKLNYRIFTIFKKPFDYKGDRSPGNGAAFYANLGLPEGAVARGGGRLIVRMPVVEVGVRGGAVIGRADKTNDQITKIYGGWANHIGYWYEPTTHIWRFRIKKRGSYRVTFGLIGEGKVKSEVLRRPLSVKIAVRSVNANAKLLSPEKIVTDNDALGVVVHAEEGNVGIAISSETVSSRLLDYIRVEPLAS